jgi:hypothetical protein
MNHERPKRSVAVTAVLLAVSVALWATLAVGLVVVLPRYKHDFRDRGAARRAAAAAPGGLVRPAAAVRDIPGPAPVMAGPSGRGGG